jgi:Tol biopolymer transport system component
VAFVVLALTLAACGGDGATKTADSPPETKPVDSLPDPNKDRLEITFGYASGLNISMASMDLFQITKDGRLATPLVSTSGLEMYPEWSNDGTKLVFTKQPDANSSVSLWVANADLTGLRQLVVDSNPPPNYFNNQDYGSWSPDGASIAFLRMIADTASGVAVMGADGSGVRWLAPGGDAPSWSTTNRIAFGKDGFIWTVSPDGSGLLRLTSADGDFFPKWSRDGSKLVFLHATPSVGTNHDKDFDVVTIRADGTDRRTLVTGAINETPSWSPDGTYVLYDRRDITDPSQPKCAVYKVPAAGGPSINLTPDRGVGYCGGSSWRPM